MALLRIGGKRASAPGVVPHGLMPAHDYGGILARIPSWQQISTIRLKNCYTATRKRRAFSACLNRLCAI